MSKRPQNPNIDFSKMIDSDEVESIADYARGVMAILNALELTANQVTHPYQDKALNVLQVCLGQMVEEMEGLKPKVDYMGDFMRYETVKHIGGK